MTNTPPGWYPYPSEGPNVQRFWDGAAWTENYDPPRGAAAPTPQQYYAAPQQYAAPGSAPAAKKSSLWIVLVVAAVVLVPVIGGGGAVIGLIAKAAEINSQMEEIRDIEIHITEVPAYVMEDREGWDELVDRCDALADKYRAIAGTDAMYDIVPMTDAGRNYYQAFRYIVADYCVALIWSPGRTSTDPQELDDYIADMDEKLTEVERKLLANEDFGVSVRIVQSDGTVFESGGTLPERVDLDNAIAFVASYTAQPDAGGSYAAAGEEMAAAFGMHLTWTDGVGGSSCTPASDGSRTLAYYCQLDPEVIYLNSRLIDQYDSRLVNTVRHELAHHAITETCGVKSPPSAGGRVEGVANSYAIIYLGMPASATSAQPDAYQVDEATNAVATAIHGGQCS